MSPKKGPSKPYDPSDADQVKERSEMVRVRVEREANDWRWVMSSPEGRRFMWRMIGQCKVHHSTFNTNALAMAHAEGERNVGLFLEAETINVDPKLYVLMFNEAQENSNA